MHLPGFFSARGSTNSFCWRNVASCCRPLAVRSASSSGTHAVQRVCSRFAQPQSASHGLSYVHRHQRQRPGSSGMSMRCVAALFAIRPSANSRSPESPRMPRTPCRRSPLARGSSPASRRAVRDGRRCIVVSERHRLGRRRRDVLLERPAGDRLQDELRRPAVHHLADAVRAHQGPRPGLSPLVLRPGLDDLERNRGAGGCELVAQRLIARPGRIRRRARAVHRLL